MTRRHSVHMATHALLTALIDQGEAGTDDGHARYELPPSVDQRMWGAIVAGLLACGIIVRTGDAHTTRRIAHGRRIGRYRLVDRAKAIVLRDRLAASAARQRDRQMVLPGIDLPDGTELLKDILQRHPLIGGRHHD